MGAVEPTDAEVLGDRRQLRRVLASDALAALRLRGSSMPNVVGHSESTTSACRRERVAAALRTQRTPTGRRRPWASAAVACGCWPVPVSEPFVHELRVRYGECDPQGIVFNANYLLYFDVVFTELWREAVGPWQEMVERGLDAVVAEASLRFRSPARFDDVLRSRARIERARAHERHDGDRRVSATARSSSRAACATSSSTRRRGVRRRSPDWCAAASARCAR